MHLPGHKFTGPGIRLCKRLNSDETPKGRSILINRVDNAVYHHDLCYLKHDDIKTRNEACDKTMLNELIEIVIPTLRKELINQFLENSLVRKLILGWVLL